MKTIESLNELPSVAAYLDRIGAEPQSFNTAVVKDYTGKYPKTVAKIKFWNDGQIYCSNDFYAPDGNEIEAMAIDLATIKFPETVLITSLDKPPIDPKSDNFLNGDRLAMNGQNKFH